MNKLFNKKKIILIIGGGIAAYKSLDLIRLLKKYQCEVKVVLTESGKKFVIKIFGPNTPDYIRSSFESEINFYKSYSFWLVSL